MQRVGIALMAAATLVVLSIGPAQAAGWAEISRTLYLTARPSVSAYAETENRSIWLTGGSYVAQVLLWNEDTYQTVPGSRREEMYWAPDDGWYQWKCDIGGEVNYTYTVECRLLRNRNGVPSFWYVTSGKFGIGSNGVYTLRGRLIPG
ncbi:hypothetical protein [Yinghuangia seranimata]|uniref:hypothetical protein n=1 Tax=Yinghuangia seranimata TaxID=408067 RepID=UPI00248BB31C|nr:hypothetical protein [Yinghuangia seranimata]MDI2129438.1 hypothetical protein [Yinghuangia seranimata]